MNARPLCERWRTTAAQLRRYGADDQAAALEACADELEAAQRAYLFEALTVEQAAAEAGVCQETIRRRVRRGDLPNVGDGGRIAVQRADLLPHVEPSGPRPVTEAGEPDVAAELLNSRA